MSQLVIGLLWGLGVGFVLGGLTAFLFEDTLRGPIMRVYDDWISLKNDRLS